LKSSASYRFQLFDDEVLVERILHLQEDRQASREVNFSVPCFLERLVQIISLTALEKYRKKWYGSLLTFHGKRNRKAAPMIEPISF